MKKKPTPKPVETPEAEAPKAPEKEPHPLAQIFPLLVGKPMAELTADIQQHGLREKIVLLDGKILDGRNRYRACLDGKVWPQFEQFDPVKHGESPLNFVMSRNLKRRHLTASQRAAIAVQSVLPIFVAEAKERQRASGAATGKANAKSNRMISPKLGESSEAPQKESWTIPGTNIKSFIKSFANPPKAAAPQPKKAAEQAGEVMDVSRGLIEEAKALGEEAPAKLEEVVAGKKTLGKATREAGMESVPVADALNRIENVCGKSLAAAIREGTRLKKGPKEIIAYAAETDEVMIGIRGLIDHGWDLKRALAYKVQSVGRTHRVGDLLDRAAAGGGQFTLEIEGWVVCVTKANGK